MVFRRSCDCQRSGVFWQLIQYLLHTYMVHTEHFIIPNPVFNLTILNSGLWYNNLALIRFSGSVFASMLQYAPYLTEKS